MTRIFCSTNHCGFQAAQLEAAQAAIADLRARCDALLAERDAAQAENERLRDALDEAGASVEFYLDLFCLERARQGAGR